MKKSIIIVTLIISAISQSFAQAPANRTGTQAVRNAPPNATQQHSLPNEGNAPSAVQLQPQGTAQPTGAGVSPTQNAVSKEIKETSAKEIKEIKDRPSDIVEIVSALAWPFTILALAWVLSREIRASLKLAPRLVRKIKAGGVEMEINAEVADQIRQYLGSSIKELREKADDEYVRSATVQQLDQHIYRVFSHALPRVLQANGLPLAINQRATIHVQDIVFKQYLYQITEYFPRQGSKKQGRRFSQRFGSMGRAWRMGQSLGEGNAFGPGTPEEELVKEWGMTREEAQSASRTSRPADLCVLLKSPEDGNIPIGMLYIDSTITATYGDDATATAVAKSLENEQEVIDMAKAVARAMAPLRLAAPDLAIMEE
jgi:hypothetical protein